MIKPLEVPASSLRYPMPGVVPGRDALVVRPHVIADVPGIVDGIAASLTELKRFMPWAHLPQTEQSQRARVAAASASYWRGEDCTMGIYARATASGQDLFVGSTGLHDRTLNPKGREVGYWIHSGHAGRGIATLATRCLIVYGFSYLGLTRIQCGHDVNNHASAKVNEKCGFRIEGSLRNFDRVPTSELVRDGWEASGEIVMRGLVPADVASLAWYRDVLAHLEVADWLGQTLPRPNM